MMINRCCVCVFFLFFISPNQVVVFPLVFIFISDVSRRRLNTNQPCKVLESVAGYPGSIQLPFDPAGPERRVGVGIGIGRANPGRRRPQHVAHIRHRK